jgi:hypothetical protein
MFKSSSLLDTLSSRAARNKLTTEDFEDVELLYCRVPGSVLLYEDFLFHI